jgi:hypothetical protein
VCLYDLWKHNPTYDLLDIAQVFLKYAEIFLCDNSIKSHM